MRPTNEQLAAWRALADAATEGPLYAVEGGRWEEPLSYTGDGSEPLSHDDGGWTVSRRQDRPGWRTDGVRPDYGIGKRDAEFFAAAREAVPALLDEVARLREVVAALPKCHYGGCNARATHMVVYEGGRFDSDTGEHEDEDGLACDEHVFEARPLVLPYAAALRALEGR